MNLAFSAVAVMISAVALFLPTRSQTFTHVAVDGRDIRMLMGGSGPSTVVFESGLAAPLETWGKIQTRVSRFARTVTYDRMGVGLSGAAAPPRDGRHIADELHRALRAAGVQPPYVLTGASSGGLYIRVFAGMYPDEVSGMVLVDPTVDAGGSDRSTLPELAALAATVQQAETSGVPRGVPVVLIDAISPRDVPFATTAVREARARLRVTIEAESRAYRMWVDRIPGARLIVTEFSSHNVPIEQPQLVIDAIRQVVEQQRR